jgi:hypothetical protein
MGKSRTALGWNGSYPFTLRCFPALSSERRPHRHVSFVPNAGTKDEIDLDHLYWKVLGIALQPGSGSGRLK